VRLGHKVIVFTTNSNLDEDLDVPTNQPIDVEGVQVWYFKHEEPIKRWLPFIPYLAKSIGFLYAPAMRAQLDKIIPTVDVVHTQMPYVYPTYASSWAAIRHHKPLFYHQRGGFDPESLKFRSLKKRLYIRAIERPIMRRANTLIALTDAEVRSYRALGVQTQCQIIPNGVEIVKPKRCGDSTCSAWGIEPDDLLILFLGRLHPTKGADRLLRAFMKIEGQFPHAKLIMAGPDEFGILEKFQAEIKGSGLQKRVIFTGMVTGDVKQDLLERSNLFCLPSDTEGFSMAVLEALANSTAVLLSPGCHFPEVEASGIGRIVSAEACAIAKAMGELLKDKQALKEMGRKGREFVVAHYSWNTIVNKMEDVYHKGIERHLSRNH
jgi:glycosyltransferase involved in cell wall biosynthesis